MKKGFKNLKKIAGFIFTLCFMVMLSGVVCAEPSVTQKNTSVTMASVGDERTIAFVVENLAQVNGIASYDFVITSGDASGFRIKNKSINTINANKSQLNVTFKSINKKGNALPLKLTMNYKNGTSYTKEFNIPINWANTPTTSSNTPDVEVSGSNAYYISDGDSQNVNFLLSYNGCDITSVKVSVPDDFTYYSVSQNNTFDQGNKEIIQVNISANSGYSENNKIPVTFTINYKYNGKDALPFEDVVYIYNTNAAGTIPGNDLTFSHLKGSSLTFGSAGVKLTEADIIKIDGLSDTITLNSIEANVFTVTNNMPTDAFVAEMGENTANSTTTATFPVDITCRKSANAFKLKVTVIYVKKDVLYHQDYYFDYTTDLEGVAEATSGTTYDGVYGDPDTLTAILDPYTGVGAVIFSFAKVIAAILTFVCVVVLGINIILARGKGEERTNAMQGFMYITIGIIILDLALVIYELLNGLAGDPSEDLTAITSSLLPLLK